MMGNKTSEDELRRYGKRVVYLLNGGLPFLVEKQGGVFLGITLKGYEGDYLLVVRADFEGKKFVSFAGAATGCGALVRWEQAVRAKELKWKRDKWDKSGGKS